MNTGIEGTHASPAAARTRLTVPHRAQEQTLDSGAWVWTGLTEDGYPGSAEHRCSALTSRLGLRRVSPP